MATITRVLTEFDNGSGVVRVEVDFDDATLRLQAVRCVNGSLQDAIVDVVRDSDGLVRAFVYAAGTTTSPIPTAGSQRIDVTWDGTKLKGFRILAS